MANIDPGWNDPPPITVVEKTKLRNVLNKRISFKFSESNSTATNNEMHRITKMPQSAQSVNLIPPTEVNQINIIELRNTLIEFLETLSDINRKVDILKRLDIMTAMWQDDKLNAQIKEQIFAFVECLKSQNKDRANEIYLHLISHSASFCNTWIIAFKYILHHCTQINSE